MTSIDLDEPTSAPVDDDHRMDIAALLELELTSGRRVTLLDDRGWTSGGPSDIWSYTSLKELADTARTVVGPDEPPEGTSIEDAVRQYWTWMAAIARAQGMVVSAEDLAALPHDVDVSQAIQKRVVRTAR